jgi:hypothetical protein
MQKSFGMMHQLFELLETTAQKSLRDWMIRIAGYVDDTAILNMSQHPAGIGAVLWTDRFYDFDSHVRSPSR